MHLTTRRGFTAAQALAVAEELGIDLDRAGFTLEGLRHGMEIELEHGRHDPEADVTGDDPIITGKIAWAHLKERPDYYALLARLESTPRQG